MTKKKKKKEKKKKNDLSRSERKPMKGLGETSPFLRFTNPRRDKSVYFLAMGYLFTIYYIPVKTETPHVNFLKIFHNFESLTFRLMYKRILFFMTNKNQKCDPLRAMKTFIRNRHGHTT